MKIVDALKNATATWAFVLANVVIFVSTIAGVDSNALSLSSDLSAVLRQPWRLLSYMFTQAYPLHLLCNLITLILVCSWYESRRKAAGLAVVYFASGLAGAILFILTGLFATSEATLSGCSASVLGIAAFVVCDRMHKIRHWRVIILIALVIAATGVAGPNPGGSVAHVGGILAGALMGLCNKPRTDEPGDDTTAADILIRKAELSGFSSLSDAERKRLISK